MILLDTSVMVEILDDGPRANDIRGRMESIPEDEIIAYSAITHFELVQAGGPERAHKAVIIQVSKLIPVDQPITEKAAEIFTRSFARSRRRIPDALIAATAITFKCPLWTFDTDFKNIPGLKLF